MSRASASSNTTTASALIAPFLVAPSDSTSTPARQVSSAGVQPRAATALAKRAPSMCTCRPWRWATAHSAVISAVEYERAEVGRLREVERERLHARRVAAAGERERLVERRGLELEVAARQGHQLGAGEELGCAALVDVDVRRLVAEDRAERVGERGERHRVRAGAARQREDPHRALEQRGEALVHGPGVVVVAVGCGGAGVRRQQRLEDLGGGAADVVAAEVVRGSVMGGADADAEREQA